MRSLIFTVCILIPFLSLAKPIRITQQSDLNFGSAPQGDGPKIVLPGTSETAENASFKVTGDKNTAYTITLPASMTMTTGAGGVGRTITVNNFSSYPMAGANGLLNNTGTQMLYVGATRAMLSVTQVAGSYVGTFTVTVVY